MVTIIKYKPAQWLAMLSLKSSLKYMQGNNEFLPELKIGRYDRALEKNRKTLKYFLTEVPEREVA